MQNAQKTTKTLDIVVARIQPDQIRSVRRAASKEGNEALLDACYASLEGDLGAFGAVAQAILTAAAERRYLYVTKKRGRMGIRDALESTVWYPGQAATELMQDCDDPTLLARYFAVFEPNMGLSLELAS